jgi:hypothetical protein
VSDDLTSQAELVWENEGGRLRPAPLDRAGEGPNDNDAAEEGMFRHRESDHPGFTERPDPPGRCVVLDDRERELLLEIERGLLIEDPAAGPFLRSCSAVPAC